MPETRNATGAILGRAEMKPMRVYQLSGRTAQNQSSAPGSTFFRLARADLEEMMVDNYWRKEASRTMDVVGDHHKRAGVMDHPLATFLKRALAELEAKDTEIAALRAGIPTAECRICGRTFTKNGLNQTCCLSYGCRLERNRQFARKHRGSVRGKKVGRCGPDPTCAVCGRPAHDGIPCTEVKETS